MAQSQIDLNEVANNTNLRISITSPIEEHPADAKIRRIKDFILFIIALFFILCTFTFCGHVILDTTFGNDEKKWAMLIASGIISAFLGFLSGKKIG